MEMTKERTDAFLKGERIDVINRDIRLIQNSNGLLYGTDAYMLAAFMRKASCEDACELGAGTGVISLLAMSKGKFKSCLCVEVQEYYAGLCVRNAELNGMSDRIAVVHSDLRELPKREYSGRYGVVFSNPPYMQVGNGKRNVTDEKYIARHEACGGIRDFIKCAAMLLKFGGYFYCVIRCDRLADVFCFMREFDIEPKRMRLVCADASSEPSMALIEGIRGGKMSLKVEPTLFLNENGCASDISQRVYSDLEFT